MGSFPQNRVLSLPVNNSWLQYSSLTTSSVLYILPNYVSDSWNVPSLKLSTNFCRVLLVIFRGFISFCLIPFLIHLTKVDMSHFSNIVGTIVAYSDCTSRCSDYVLNIKQVCILAWTLLIYEIIMQWIRYTKSLLFSSFSRNHVMNFCACALGL